MAPGTCVPPPQPYRGHFRNPVLGGIVEKDEAEFKCPPCPQNVFSLLPPHPPAPVLLLPPCLQENGRSSSSFSRVLGSAVSRKKCACYFLTKPQQGCFLKRREGREGKWGRKEKKKRKGQLPGGGWVGVPGSHGFECIWHLNLKD